MDKIELKDISIASFLYSLKQVKFLGKRRLPTGEVLFQFGPKNTVEKLIQSYWNSEAPLIQAKLLFSAQRDLKDMIFCG